VPTAFLWLGTAGWQEDLCHITDLVLKLLQQRERSKKVSHCVTQMLLHHLLPNPQADQGN